MDTTENTNAAGVQEVREPQPSLAGVEAVSEDDNQWFGDMMILQVLADSDNVNEQEREVLTRWMTASDRPTTRAAGVVIPAELFHRMLERLEFPGPSWVEHRAGLAAELRALFHAGVDTPSPSLNIP